MLIQKPCQATLRLKDAQYLNVRKIVVNLSQVQSINSTSIGTLTALAKRLQGQDGDLKIYGLADNIKRAFDLIGASSIVSIYDSEDSALAAF